MEDNLNEKNGVELKGISDCLTNKEILMICKVLLESRAIEKTEIDSLIGKLLSLTEEDDKIPVRDLIINDYFNYIPPRHDKKLTDVMWSLYESINNQEKISFAYRRKDGKHIEKTVKPAAIMFSESFFYLICYAENLGNDMFTVFRIDRIKDIKNTNESFSINYEDGSIKKIPFVYSGEMSVVKFEYTGSDIEEILDMLPTAVVSSKVNGPDLVHTEMYGRGMEIWLKEHKECISNVKYIR